MHTYIYRFPFNFVAELTKSTREEIQKASKEKIFDSSDPHSVIKYIHKVREDKNLPSLRRK